MEVIFIFVNFFIFVFIFALESPTCETIMESYTKALSPVNSRAGVESLPVYESVAHVPES